MPLDRRQVVLAKVEATIGDDPTHAATDAQIVYGPEWGKEFDRYGRAILSPTLTAMRSSILGRRSQTFTCRTEFRGTAADYTDVSIVPEYDAFLRACGMSASYDDAGDTWTYAPISDPADFKTVAIEGEQDGKAKIMLGAVGNPVFTFDPGAPGFVDWSFAGLWTDVAARALTTPDYSTDVEPPLVVETGFQPFSEGPSAPTFGHCRLVTIDLRNQIVLRSSQTVGGFGVVAGTVVGRGPADDPGIEVVIEVEQKVDGGSDDWWARWQASPKTASASATITLGSGTAGNEHVITLSRLVVEDIEDIVFDDGLLGHRVTCRGLGSSGMSLAGTADDEFTIVAT
jgi:hypothetical protein